MPFDFDTVTDRHDTNCLKYDFAAHFGIPEDNLSLWVADMDFPAPPCVEAALTKAVRHGIYGYNEARDGYYAAIVRWFSRHFDWQLQPQWIKQTPGVVFALASAIRIMTQPGDAVLIQSPVYFPFYETVQRNGRILVESPLVYKDLYYSVDFDAFEKTIVKENVKLFILCSPHNPVGRVWTQAELQRMGEICRKHGVKVVSDEIHCDFAFPDHPHTPFLKACPDMTADAIVCTAPSKTFNLAGLQTSNIIIPDEKLRAAFQSEMDRLYFETVNCLGLVACQAAYEGGEEWLTECKAYLRANLEYVRQYLAENIPQIKPVRCEGTYFAWLDFSGLGLSKEQLDELIIHKAKLWLHTGTTFGKQSAQFQRMVLACPRTVLEKAMAQLKAAVEGL